MSRLGVVTNQWMDSEGRPLKLGYLYSYAPGTTTPKDTYNDSTLLVANPNPMQFDGSGRLFDVFLTSGGYKLEVRDVNDVVIWSQDDVYAAVDGTDLANLETEIDQNKEDLVTVFSVYDEDSSPASSTAYELTLQESSLTAPTAYKQGMTILFKPQLANTTTTPTVNVEGLGAKGLRDYDGVSLFAASDLSTANYYMFQYDGSVFRLFWRSGDIGTADMLDDSVTLAKMAGGTEAKVITYDASGDPKLSADTIQLWNTHDESGALSSGSSYEIANIDDSATKIEIICTNLSVDVDETLYIQVGYGATPTYLTTAGDYIGTEIRVNAAGDAKTAWSTFANVGAIEAGNNDCYARILMDKFNDGTDDTWQITVISQNDNGTSNSIYQGGGRIKGSAWSSNALSAVKLVLSGGNAFDNGYITTKVYQDFS